MKTVIIILFFSQVLFSCANNTVTTKVSKIETVSPPVLNPSKYDKVGFGCGYAGEKTELVKKFTAVIKDKNYQSLRTALFSVHAGEIYLATVSCVQLAEDGILTLDETEARQIEINRNNGDTLATCSGCGGFENFTVKELLGDSANYISISAKYWLYEVLDKTMIEDQN